MAITLLNPNSIHLVFPDIELPDRCGLALPGSLKVHLPNIKTVMVTGSGTKDNVVGAISKGVLGFIIKPFNKARVKEALCHLIEHHKKRKTVKVERAHKKLIDYVRETHY